jgi:DNA-binding IclR family transcriptional regulator
MKDTLSNYGTIDKTVRILKSLLPQNQDVGTVELSKKVGINKSTVSRILRAMATHQLVYQDPVSKKYSLGNFAVSIGQAAIGSFDQRIVRIAKPHMDELRDQSKQPVGLEILSGNRTVFAWLSDNRRFLSVSIPVGMRMPAHAGAGAKAILAFSPPEVSDNLLGGELKRYTPNTITDREALDRHLTEIKRTGIAFDRGEVDSDLYTAAAPIFNKNESPVAAVTILVPSYRGQTMLKKEIKVLLVLLKEAATRISLSLKRSEGLG